VKLSLEVMGVGAQGPAGADNSDGQTHVKKRSGAKM
jgi:hypothetical protein